LPQNILIDGGAWRTLLSLSATVFCNSSCLRFTILFVIELLYLVFVEVIGNLHACKLLQIGFCPIVDSKMINTMIFKKREDAIKRCRKSESWA